MPLTERSVKVIRPSRVIYKHELGEGLKEPLRSTQASLSLFFEHLIAQKINTDKTLRGHVAHLTWPPLKSGRTHYFVLTKEAMVRREELFRCARTSALHTHAPLQPSTPYTPPSILCSPPAPLPVPFTLFPMQVD